jgi:hypothetical protein
VGFESVNIWAEGHQLLSSGVVGITGATEMFSVSVSHSKVVGLLVVD